MNEARTYSSPLRQRQTEDTRRRIVEAALEMIRQSPQDSLSHEEVAKRSEIALRTIYRHFPARTDLLDAVWQETDRRLELSHYPETERELLDSLETVFGKMDQNAALICGLLHSHAGLEMRRRDNERRRSGVVKALQDATAHLADDKRKYVIAVFQALYSARTWEMMRERAHLKEGEVGHAVRWAMETLLKGLAIKAEQLPFGAGSTKPELVESTARGGAPQRAAPAAKGPKKSK